jgi:hypothetical protein
MECGVGGKTLQRAMGSYQRVSDVPMAHRQLRFRYGDALDMAMNISIKPDKRSRLKCSRQSGKQLSLRGSAACAIVSS